jgi:hypothetical protein
MKHLEDYLTKIHRKCSLTWIDLRHFGDGSGNVKIQYAYLYGKKDEKNVEIFKASFWNDKSKNEAEYRAVKALEKWTHCNCTKFTRRIKADERRIHKYAMKHINDDGGG